MGNHWVRTLVLLTMACLARPVAADPLDRIPGSGDLPQQRGYSDFTTPLGRFMDLLAAGDISGARAIQPQACAAWRNTRQMSGWTGKFWARDVELDLDTICGPR